MEGDLNTKFFHAITKQRRARNKITSLIGSEGNLVEEEKKLVAIATGYFRELFQSSNPELIDEALANVTTTITDRLNADLTAPISEWEVKSALLRCIQKRSRVHMDSRLYSTRSSGTLLKQL